MAHSYDYFTGQALPVGLHLVVLVKLNGILLSTRMQLELPKWPSWL